MQGATLGALVAVVLLAAPAYAQDVTVQVVQAPAVVVASDFEGEERTTPRYLFSAAAEVTNGRTQRQIVLNAIVYLDRSTEGCPERTTGVRPVHLFEKRAMPDGPMDPGERAILGGDAVSEQGQELAYWPMETFRRYPSPLGGVDANPEGEHTFCVLALVTGEDPACDKPDTQVCVLASDDFRAYVRHSNARPTIGPIEVVPNTPSPGDQVVLRATASDTDTVPRPDTLSYAWRIENERPTGPVVRHRFSAQGTFPVTLTVSDSFETVTSTVNVTVRAQGTGSDGGATNGAPGPGAWIVVALSLAALGWKRRGRGTISLK